MSAIMRRMPTASHENDDDARSAFTEAHGGTIRAESEGAGKGSVFVVEFPV